VARCTLAAAALLATAPAAGARQIDYVIGKQDVLTITVYNQADLSGRFNVESDGTLLFPLVGRVKAGGLTPRQVETELRKRLADGYFKDPQITVAVEQYRSQQVFVVGEVRQPGTYPLSGDMTVIEVLSRAGSTTANASGKAVIVRAAPSQSASGPVLPNQVDASQVLHVDLRELEKGVLSENVALRHGDTIFVPKAETIYLVGHVRSPGSFAVDKMTTVLQALSLAGGATDRGATGRIRIIRMLNGKKTEVKAKLNDVVQPGDTIVVPERRF
jgi:polysaccharide export outer membrane protein